MGKRKFYILSFGVGEKAATMVGRATDSSVNYLP